MRKPEQPVQKSRGKLGAKTAEQFSVDRAVIERVDDQIKMQCEQQPATVVTFRNYCAPYCFPNQITPYERVRHSPPPYLAVISVIQNANVIFRLFCSKICYIFVVQNNAISPFLLQNFLLLSVRMVNIQ